MKIGSFEFNLRELSGSMGDMGTLLPLAVGYFAVCGLDPAGLLVMMGLANIATGIVYKLPMPIEPMKVLAVMAIAQSGLLPWSTPQVLPWGLSGCFCCYRCYGLGRQNYSPFSHSRHPGVLGVLLAVEALKMLSTWWLLGLISLAVVLLLQNGYAPGALVLIVLGLVIMVSQGEPSRLKIFEMQFPVFTSFAPGQVWEALLLAGFAQIPLTATNAVIATSSLISTYWPDRHVSERRLSLNMGIMNLVFPFFGGMPLCHGAGGLAGQYYFGARTGGANIIEGVIEISLGLFFASSIAYIFAAFPMAVVGAMMFLVGIEMVKFTRDISVNTDLLPMGVTVAVSLLTNMAFGFLAGLAIFYFMKAVLKKEALSSIFKKD